MSNKQQVKNALCILKKADEARDAIEKAVMLLRECRRNVKGNEILKGEFEDECFAALENQLFDGAFDTLDAKISAMAIAIDDASDDE